MNPRTHKLSAGVTLIEMMVTVLIGAFLMIGVISMFAQSRTTFRVSDTVARMQENVRFALATMQPDIRLAQNWGLTNVGANLTVPGGIIVRCPNNAVISAWVLDRNTPVEASNGAYPAALVCPPFSNAFQAGSDVLVVRHASGTPTLPTNTVVQIQTNRIQGVVFNDAAPPLGAGCATCSINDWQTHAYYVASSSSLGPNVPSLRRKTLVNGVLQDQELIPGVEDFQVQLGVDTDATDNDDTVARYVNPGDAILDPLAAGFNPNAKVLTVHIWLMIRAEQPEGGFVDGNTYNYADVANYTPADGFRRVLVDKTIVLRNARGQRI